VKNIKAQEEGRYSFMGEFHYSVDDKGRVCLPNNFRSPEKTEIRRWIITKGLDRSLFLFPETVWNTDVIPKIKNLTLTNANHRIFTRLFFSPASEAELDSQGRISIPQPLRLYAGITREAVLLGVMRRVEIWDKSLWVEYTEQQSRRYETVVSEIGDIGL